MLLAVAAAVALGVRPVPLAGAPQADCGAEASPAAAEAYAPVAPHQSLRAAIELNVAYTRQWLEGGDFASALQTGLGLCELTHVYRFQSDRESWRTQALELRGAALALARVLRAEDRAASEELLGTITAQLAAMGEPPTDGPAAEPEEFRPLTSLDVLMPLLENSFADVRSALRRESAERSLHASYALAEVANANIYARDDQPWRDESQALRDHILEVTAAARAADYEQASALLQQVYARCEACHERLR